MATFLSILWDLDDDLDGNVQHIARHGIAKDEVEEVLASPDECLQSHSTGRPLEIAWTSTGRRIAVVYDQIDADTVYPVTAYEIGS